MISSVKQLSRSLSDFAELLNQSGYSNILSRYQKDLASFTEILDGVASNNNTIDNQAIAGIKAVEQFFYEDETDLMKIDTITVEQAEITKDVIDEIENVCNKTNTIAQENESTEAIHTEDVTSELTTTELVTEAGKKNKKIFLKHGYLLFQRQQLQLQRSPQQSFPLPSHPQIALQLLKIQLKTSQR